MDVYALDDVINRKKTGFGVDTLTSLMIEDMLNVMLLISEFDYYYYCFFSRELTYPPKKRTFEDDFPFPKVGYVSFLAGNIPSNGLKPPTSPSFNLSRSPPRAFYTTICWWGGLEWNIKDGKRVQPHDNPGILKDSVTASQHLKGHINECQCRYQWVDLVTSSTNFCVLPL